MGKLKSKLHIGFWFMGIILLLGGCHKEDVVIYQDTRQWVEKTVVVVAPTSDPVMKARLQRTADWMQQNLHNAQLHDTLPGHRVRHRL